MYLETEFFWSHIPNAFRSRIFVVAHTYRSQSHSAHETHKYEYNYVILMYNDVIKHVVA